MARPATPLAATLVLAILATTIPARAGTPWAVELFASGLGGLIHRDPAWGFDAGVLVQASAFRAGLLAPMRFDRNGLRHRDWDERTDYGRILGELAWGERTDPLHVRLASITSLSLGVGNLVSRYASTIDPDHWRTGLVLALDFKPAGGVLFLDSILDPQVAGGRIHVRPFFWAGAPSVTRMEIGLSLVADAAAPSDPTPGAMNGRGLPTSKTAGLMAGGVDLRWPVYRSRVVEVTPYGAWSRLASSDGAHAGLALDFAPHKDVRIGLQGEWRWLGRGYVASWFDGLYMADRHDFNGVPKLRTRDGITTSRMGGMAGVVLEFRPYATLGASIDWDRRSEFRAIRSDLTVVVPDWMRLTGSVTARGFSTASDLAHPARRIGAVSVDVKLWRTIAVFGAYARDLEVVATGGASSGYRASDTVLAGLRLGLVFSGGQGGKAGRDTSER
jgi:hypothetical protein